MTHKRGAHFLLRHRSMRLGACVARRRFLPRPAMWTAANISIAGPAPSFG